MMPTAVGFNMLTTPDIPPTAWSDSLRNSDRPLNRAAFKPRLPKPTPRFKIVTSTSSNKLPGNIGRTRTGRRSRIVTQRSPRC